MSYLGNTPSQQTFVAAIDYFSGNGSTVAFTLSRPVASVAQVQVVVNNVAQNPTDAFTVLNNTITFTGAPSSGTNNIYVYYTSPITQVIAPSDGTVGTGALMNGAVTTTKLNSTTGTGAVALASLPTFATTIGVGGAAPSGSGAGITFPATQSASSNANTLDDYEEGTWTPTFSPGGGGSLLNFTYTKVGRLVQITGYIGNMSGFGSGIVVIGGLPFIGNGDYQMSMLWYNGSTSVLAAAYLAGGGTALQLRPIGGAPSTFTELSVQMTYITST